MSAMLKMILLASTSVVAPLDFALLAPDATVLHAYRADEYQDDAGVGSDEGLWPDRIGSEDLAQTTAANVPAAIADGGADFNNQPVVRPDGSGDRLITSSGSVVGQPNTVIVISKLTLSNAANKFLIDSEPGGSGALCFADASENAGLSCGTTLTSSTSVLNVATLQEFVANSTSSGIRVGSVSVAEGNAGTVSRTGLSVGTNRSGAGPWGGDIAEIIIVDGELTAADRGYLARYVAERYGIISFPITSAPTETPFSTSSTTHNVSMPATVNAGDLLVVMMMIGNVSVQINTPSGWTRKKTSYPSLSGDVFVKVADGTEGGGSVNFTSDAASEAAAQCYRVTNWYGSLDGVEVTDHVYDFSTSPDAAELTVSWGSARNLWIWLSGARDDDDEYTGGPSGYSGLTSTVSGGGLNSGASVGSAIKYAESATENPGAGTLSNADDHVSYTLAVRPRVA